MTDEKNPKTDEQNETEAHGFRGPAPVPTPEVEAHMPRIRNGNNDNEPPRKGTERDDALEHDGPEVEAHAMRGK